MSNIKFPQKIDDNTSLPDAIDNVTPVKADIVNNLKKAIIAIENELGTKPSGVNSTVKQRFYTIETAVSSLPIIDLAGDLGGTLTSPKVVGLNGISLSGTNPNNGQVLGYDGSVWKPINIEIAAGAFEAGGDLSGNNTSQTVIKIQNKNISNADPTSGQALIWDGSEWVPTNITTESVKFVDFNASLENPNTNLTSYISGGTFEYNPTLLSTITSTLTYTIRVIAETTGPTLTVQLYNLTTASVVSGSTFTFTETTPTLKTAVISSLTNGLYQFQIKMASGGNISDRVNLNSAKLRITW